ncbi:uncharacterized protein [Asterias amurensis]|uniref:uncharacterized protein isoform X1 n=3 Tax=Asterias amurensis TaxID=7602 RepID=UPI003AB8E693
MSGAVGLLAEITLDQVGSCGLSSSPSSTLTSNRSGVSHTQKPAEGIMNFSKSDLLRLLGLLEAELQARELVIASLKAERTKLLRPSNGQQRYTIANPYTALGRDVDGNGNTNNSSNGEDCKEEQGSNNALAYLEAMVAKHKKAEVEMSGQVKGLKESHAKMVVDLEEEKRKHAHDTAQGDDVTYMLEKERERLAQQLDFEKAQQKKLEKENKRSQVALVQERKKHLQFAKVILDERKVLLMELGEMKQRMEELEDMMIVKETQLGTAKACIHKERKRFTKMEAGIEMRLSEFDIEREQLRAKLNREENRTRELREELDVANNCMNDLQLSLAEARHTDASNGNRENPTSATNGRDGRAKPLGRVTGSPISAAKAGKIGTPRGIRTPPRSDKSEGSSSGSEELYSPMSPTHSKPIPGRPQKSAYQPQYGSSGKPTPGSNSETRSVENESGKTEVRSSVKHKGSLLYSKGNGKTLSPATSLDRLNCRTNTSSPPPLRGSKIPSSTGSASKGSHNVLSPQQNRKGSIEMERPAQQNRKGSVEMERTTSQRSLQPSTPSPKPAATSLVRPTALSGSTFMKAADAFKAGTKKAISSGLPGHQSQIAFQSPSKVGSSIVPKAAVSPLVNTAKKSSQQPLKPPTPTQPTAPLSKVNPPSPANVSSNLASTTVAASGQPAKVGTQQPPVFTPPAKRTVSPRGTPPPVPPNKPTLIPQKTNASSSSSCTSTTTITSATATPVSKSDSNRNSCPPTPPVRRSDSLVEARRQFYTNKLGGSPTNPRGALDNQMLLSAANINSNNSNAIDTFAIDTNDDLAYSEGPHFQKSAQDQSPTQKSTTQCCLLRKYKCSTPVIARLPPSTAPTSSSPLHQAAVAGDTATVCRLIEEKHSPCSREIDGSTPVHIAAEHGQLDCLELLLDLGGDVSIARIDGFTPLHGAAAQGHESCLDLLLERNCNTCTPDSLGWHPLHWAVANGHANCVRTLIDCGATRDCLTKAGWTPLHCAARYNHTKCLQVLLYHKTNASPDDPTPATNTLPDNNSQSDDRLVVSEVLNMADQEGWTVAHVAASTGQKECLEMLCNYGNLDLDTKDKWRRTPSDVATESCKEFLLSLEGKVVQVLMELAGNTSNSLSNQKEQNRHFVIGQLTVRPDMTWMTFDRCMVSVLANHSRDLEGCGRLKSDHESESDKCNSDEGVDYGHDLGLNANSIQSFVAGNLQWSVGDGPKSMRPYEIFSLTSEVIVHLRGIEVGGVDQLAYQMLIPSATLQNYIRLIEQYKSVVFYGFPGSGKSHLAAQLAEFVQTKHHQLNIKSHVTHLVLQSKTTQQEITKLLCSNGVYIPLSDVTASKTVPILVLDNLEKTTLPGVLSDLLKGLEQRGSQRSLQVSSPQGNGPFHLHPECIVIGTMDKTSLGLDLSTQHCFRWVQFHHDKEPVASMLPRYLLRRLINHTNGKLPSSNNQSYRAMEWICNVWQRLNDCFLRLKLEHTALGPKQFRACPVDSEGPNSVFRWFCLSWNHAIAPGIEDALRKNNSPSSNSHNYQRLASTTLYVLLQRAVFPGCPFTGEEAEDYMSSFRGVNEVITQLTSHKTGSLKRPRRSKSLDRSKTSNKAALIASKQQAALDLDGPHSDLHRSTRSMIPRRVPKPYNQIGTSDSNSNLVSQPDLIPSSPIEDSDLLESLVQLQGCQLDSQMDQLTQLQENLFGKAGTSLGVTGMTKRKSDSQSRGEKQMKRSSLEDAVPTSSTATSPGQHGKKRRSKDEDGVWDVWEETV